MFKVLKSISYAGLGFLLLPVGVVLTIVASLLAGLLEWLFLKSTELLEKAYEDRSR